VVDGNQGGYDDDEDYEDLKISSGDEVDVLPVSTYDAWKQGKFSFPKQQPPESQNNIPGRATRYIREDSDSSVDEDEYDQQEEDNLSDDEKQHNLEEQMQKSNVDLDDLKLAISFSKSLPLGQQQKFFQQFFQYFRKEQVFVDK
jgi:hypothetical protein